MPIRIMTKGSPQLSEEFLRAAEEGDIIKIDDLIAQGCPVNASDHYNDTALIIATVAKNLQLVNKLLNHKEIDTHIQGILTGTALTFAIYSEEKEIAKALLAAEEEFRNEDHPGAVNIATANKDYEMLRLLMQKGANINTYGLTNLIKSGDWAWKSPEPDARITPFSRGAFPQRKYTPLYLSIYYHDHDMMEFLLNECHADPNQPNGYSHEKGTMPLQVAAEWNDETAVRLLLKYGANPSVKEIEDDDPEIPSYLRGRRLIDKEMMRLIQDEGCRPEK